MSLWLDHFIFPTNMIPIVQSTVQSLREISNWSILRYFREWDLLAEIWRPLHRIAHYWLYIFHTVDIPITHNNSINHSSYSKLAVCLASISLFVATCLANSSFLSNFGTGTCCREWKMNSSCLFLAVRVWFLLSYSIILQTFGSLNLYLAFLK